MPAGSRGLGAAAQPSGQPAGKVRVPRAGPGGGARPRGQRAPGQAGGPAAPEAAASGARGAGGRARSGPGEPGAERAQRRGSASSGGRKPPGTDLYLYPGEAAHVVLMTSNVAFSMTGHENGCKVVFLIRRDSFVFIHQVDWQRLRPASCSLVSGVRLWLCKLGQGTCALWASGFFATFRVINHSIYIPH